MQDVRLGKFGVQQLNPSRPQRLLASIEACDGRIDQFRTCDPKRVKLAHRTIETSLKIESLLLSDQTA
ncbi:MAG: hypothetical protein ACKO3W_08805 [bacterium]